EFWREAAHKKLEKLNPTAEQWKKFDARTDGAVQELVSIRQDAIKRVWEVVERAAADIEKELSPGQRETFEDKVKPKKPVDVK
ncbi:MAG: hypothetical protein JWO94_729, partial [Verrucomicrobiaceae bacterium]|nr:hypothetical protein [Verrucomicrobiaceae bacterium]